jgi:hypothetical protein
MSNPTADQLVAAYIKIRDAIAEKNDAIKEYKEQQAVISGKLLELCKDQNLNSLKTDEGTVSRRLRSNYWTSDWDSMYKFVKDNDAYHLLEKRLHNTNVKEYLEQFPDNPPAGLQVKSEYSISIRKPTPA